MKVIRNGYLGIPEGGRDETDAELGRVCRRDWRCGLNMEGQGGKLGQGGRSSRRGWPVAIEERLP